MPREIGDRDILTDKDGNFEDNLSFPKKVPWVGGSLQWNQWSRGWKRVGQLLKKKPKTGVPK